MRQFFNLLKKDFLGTKKAFLPALLLGLPLLLLLAISTQSEPTHQISWRAAFWFCFFFSSTGLFYRSFSLENTSKNFGFYTALGISPWKILLSQSLMQIIALVLMGLTYSLITFLFWSPGDASWGFQTQLLLLTAVTLAPTGCFLGILLQTEREVIFPLFYLPFATPIVVGAHKMSLEATSSWFYIMAIFLLCGGFLSFYIFQFFFDELTQVE